MIYKRDERRENTEERRDNREERREKREVRREKRDERREKRGEKRDKSHRSSASGSLVHSHPPSHNICSTCWICLATGSSHW